MADSTQDVIEKLEAAFEGVRLGRGIGLWEAQAIDDWWDYEPMIREGRKRDERLDWTKIGHETLEQCASSPCFLDAKGFRFLIPAFLIADLRSGVSAEIVSILSSRDPFTLKKFKALNRAQRRAIRDFLIHVIDDPDHIEYRDKIKVAIETTWAR